MSSEERDERDPLQSLIAEILEAEGRGESVDREALIEHSLSDLDCGEMFQIPVRMVLL